MGALPGLSVLTLPKRGSAESDWEDAWACTPAPAGLRLAVADGATESSFAAAWARLLVERWVDDPVFPFDAESLADWLAPPQRQWRASVGGVALPWYAAEKAAQGAFAALAGLALRVDGESGIGSWVAFAVGDCCLLHLGPHSAGRFRLRRAFPVEAADEFSNRPMLLSSLPARNDRIAPHLRLAHGRFGPRDRFVLASDALAAWLLAGIELGEARLEGCLAALASGHGVALIEAERAAGRLRNDDVTLVVADCSVLAEAVRGRESRDDGAGVDAAPAVPGPRRLTPDPLVLEEVG